MEQSYRKPQRGQGDAVLHRRVSFAAQRGTDRRVFSVEIWKRFRKWGGIPTGITQNVKDLVASSREVENIFENSGFCVYAQPSAGRPGNPWEAASHFSPQQMTYVTHSDAGEGLVLLRQYVMLPFVDRFPQDTELVPCYDDQTRRGVGMRIETDKIYCGDSLEVLQSLCRTTPLHCVRYVPALLCLAGLRRRRADRAGSNAGGICFPPMYGGIPRGKAGACAGGYLLAEYRGHLLRHRQQGRPPRPQISPKAGTGSRWRFNHRAPGCKPQDLIGIPWLVALALRGDGWYLRSSIIWHKGNPMPESTRDRPSRCYEYVFLLTKSRKYYYDWQAVAEPIAPTTAGRLKSGVSKGNKYNVTVPGQNQPQKSTAPAKRAHTPTS